MNRNLSTNISEIKFKNNHVIYENFIKCTIKDYEYNLSYNPTLLSGSQGVLTPYSSSVSGSIVYITPSDNYGILKEFVTGSDFSPYVSCVGLYNDAGDLLAVAKMAAPMPLSANTDTTFLIKYDTQWKSEPYFTPSPSITATPSVTPSVTATPSLTPSVTPSPVDCTLAGIAILVPPSPSVSPTPSITPSVTPSFGASASPTPTPTVTPTVTPSPSIPSEVTLYWDINGGIGGQLKVEDDAMTSYVNASTNGTYQSGVVTLPSSNNYTVTDKCTSGSGNIINCRICYETAYTSGELDVLVQTGVGEQYSYFSLPLYMDGYLVTIIRVHLRSNNGTPPLCGA